MLEQRLTYPGIVPEEDLLGRALGPDLHGGWLEVVRVTYDFQRYVTHAYVTPDSPEKGRYVLDGFGQPWTRDCLANKSWFC